MTHRYSCFNRVLSLMLSLCLTPLYLGAQELADTSKVADFTLETVVITATRDITNRNYSVSSISTLSAATIQSRPAHSVTDAIKVLPGVRLTAIENAAFTGASIRGLGATENLVLMDGVPLNNSLANLSPVISLPAQALGRIEVVRGAGSIVYGPNAPGGAINILSAPTSRAHALGLRTQLGSFGTGKFQVQYGNTSGATIYSASLSRDYSDGYLPAADFSTWSLAAHGGWQVGQSRMKITVNHIDGDFGVPEQPGTYERFDNWRNTRVGLSWQQPFSPRLLLSSNVYFNWDQNRYLIYKDATYSQLRNTFDNRSMLYGGEVVGNVKLTDQNILAIGAQARSDRAETPLLVEDREESVLSLFAQEVMTISPRIKFNLVVRGDHHQKVGNAFNYLTGVVVQPFGGDKLLTREMKIRLSYGAAARFPSLRELYLAMPTVGMGNGNLKKESSTNFEIAFETPLGQIAQVTGSYFNARAKNMIERNFLTTPWQYTNLPEVKFSGIELELNRDFYTVPMEVKLDKISDLTSPGSNRSIRYGGFIRYSYLRTKETETGLALHMRPRNQLSVGVRAQINRLSASVTAQGVGVQAYPIIINTKAGTLRSDAGLDAYTLVDAKLQYRLSQRIGLAISAENLADKTYFIENDNQLAPTIQGPPRRVTGELILNY